MSTFLAVSRTFFGFSFSFLRLFFCSLTPEPQQGSCLPIILSSNPLNSPWCLVKPLWHPPIHHSALHLRKEDPSGQAETPLPSWPKYFPSPRPQPALQECFHADSRVLRLNIYFYCLYVCGNVCQCVWVSAEVRRRGKMLCCWSLGWLSTAC